MIRMLASVKDFLYIVADNDFDGIFLSLS